MEYLSILSLWKTTIKESRKELWLESLWAGFLALLPSTLWACSSYGNSAKVAANSKIQECQIQRNRSQCPKPKAHQKQNTANKHFNKTPRYKWSTLQTPTKSIPTKFTSALPKTNPPNPECNDNKIQMSINSDILIDEYKKRKTSNE
jgi:hypothetical protein